jgi:hypothetical protein
MPLIDFTQPQLDALLSEARSLVPADKTAELEADIKAKEIFPNVLGRFLERFVAAMEADDMAKYIDKPDVTTNNGGVRKPDQSNPWSAAGWNVTAQSGLVKRLGKDKADAIATAAGCKVGSTRPNPAFN